MHRSLKHLRLGGVTLKQITQTGAVRRTFKLHAGVLSTQSQISSEVRGCSAKLLQENMWRPLLKRNFCSRSDIERLNLHTLCGNGDIQGVRKLIAEHVDLNSMDNIGFTPLHWAAEKDHTEIVTLLINAGSAVDCRAKGYDNEGATPLWFALWFNKDITTASVLRDYGANINHQDTNGNTLLHRAADQKRIDIVRHLLNWNVDITLLNEEGFTVEQISLSDEITCLLKEQRLRDVDAANRK